MLPELPSKTKSKTQEIKQQRISLLTGIKGDCFLRSVKMEEGAAGEGAPAAAGADDKKIVHTYPLVKTTDMPEEMWGEVMEFVVTGCEKFAYNYELASKLIKQGLDQRFGAPWNIVVGEAYGYEISYLVGSLMFMYTGGNIACICWKAPQL